MSTKPKLRRWIFITLASLLLFGALHHVDHLIRGNHVGWPAIPEVNAFTFSLMAYPLFALGLSALTKGRVWAGYWLTYGITTLFALLVFHFIPPFIVEPVADIYLPYLDPLATANFALAPEQHLEWFQVTVIPFAGVALAVLAVFILVSAIVSSIMLILVSLRIRKLQGHW